MYSASYITCTLHYNWYLKSNKWLIIINSATALRNLIFIEFSILFWKTLVYISRIYQFNFNLYFPFVDYHLKSPRTEIGIYTYILNLMWLWDSVYIQYNSEKKHYWKFIPLYVSGQNGPVMNSNIKLLYTHTMLMNILVT